MPLIDITTNTGWHNNARDCMVNRLGQGLPAAFIARASELWLDDDTPEDAVQVDYHEYHKRAVNPADIWLLVRFTEDNLTEAQQCQVRDTVQEIVAKLLGDYATEYDAAERRRKPSTPADWIFSPGNPLIVIDCFWGPGKGCMIYNDGREPFYW